MEIDTLANIGVSIGTILLAIFTFLSIRNSKKQLSFLESQTKLMRNQINPFLQVSNVLFDKNTISLKLQNIGDSNAHEIGIRTYYEPVALLGVAQNNDLSLYEAAKIEYSFQEAYSIKNREQQIKKWHEYFNDDKLADYFPNLYFERLSVEIYDPDIKENNKILNNDFVTFSNCINTNFIVAPDKDLREFSCTPFFNAIYINFDKMYDSRLYSAKILSKNMTASRRIEIHDLIKIMDYNNIDFLNINFELVYKNKFEDLQEEVFLAGFVFSRKKHANLQEAFEQGFDMGKIIGHREMEQKLGGINYYQYSNEKSARNYDDISK